MSELKALEFFSGIGAFRLVAGEAGIKVVSAYDQSDHANAVYLHNFGEHPCGRNLSTISGADLPEADFWWLSPPCQPFSRRGRQADLDDPRAQALVNLIRLLRLKTPDFLAMENVLGFLGSRAEAMLAGCLAELGYRQAAVSICSTQLGIPMLRPRLFYLASRKGEITEFAAPPALSRPLSEFIDPDCSNNAALLMPESVRLKYADSLNIISVDDPQARTICFTSGYFRCVKASGSLISLPDNRLRYFAPEEILKLMGFPESFCFPADMPLSCKFRLAGNSIDLRSLRTALSLLPLCE